MHLRAWSVTLMQFFHIFRNHISFISQIFNFLIVFLSLLFLVQTIHTFFQSLNTLSAPSAPIFKTIQNLRALGGGTSQCSVTVADHWEVFQEIIFNPWSMFSSFRCLNFSFFRAHKIVLLFLEHTYRMYKLHWENRVLYWCFLLCLSFYFSKV